MIGQRQMSLLISTIFIMLAVGLFSCKSDECKLIRCKNGGVCIDGDCVCHDINSGSVCQNCLCQNGGVCDGTRDCDCPPKYNGQFCENFDPNDTIR